MHNPRWNNGGNVVFFVCAHVTKNSQHQGPQKAMHYHNWHVTKRYTNPESRPIKGCGFCSGFFYYLFIFFFGLDRFSFHFPLVFLHFLFFSLFPIGFHSFPSLFPCFTLVFIVFSLVFLRFPHFWLVFHCFPLVFIGFSLVFLHYFPFFVVFHCFSLVFY